MFWRGFLYVISGLMPISLLRYIPKDSLYAQLFTGTIGSIPAQFVWYIILAIVLGVVLHLSKFGNWIYSTGANGDAARAMGVNVNWTKITCYMLLGAALRFCRYDAGDAAGFVRRHAGDRL